MANTWWVALGSYGEHSATTEETVNLTSYGIDLKSLTGQHTITLLIEERVSEGQTTADIKGKESGSNVGGIATVKIDNTAITHTYAALNYYGGICAFANYTNADLDFYTTKCSLNYNSNGGSACSTEYYYTGDTVSLLPTPTYGAYTFDGWYTKR